MFGSIVVAGINILLSVELDRRAMVIVGTSLAMGLGVTYAPEIVDALPIAIKNVLSSGISAGGLTAIGLNWLLPYDQKEGAPEQDDTNADELAELEA